MDDERFREPDASLAATPPPPPPQAPRPPPLRWQHVAYRSASNGGSVPPCQRSLHVASIYQDSMYLFGGYDGTTRVNDFHCFSFSSRSWSVLPPCGNVPSPRDRHVGIVHKDCFLVFGGYDGTARVNDFYQYDFVAQQWSVIPTSTPPPSPRHSHAVVTYGNSLFVFGGYDGSYRNDFHEFDFGTCSWHKVPTEGRLPRARYRTSCVAHKSKMYLFGGHDGSRHLNDVHVFNFNTTTWSEVITEGLTPIPRDSHVAVTYGDSMFVFGGSTGSAMHDFHTLALRDNPEASRWSPVQVYGVVPCPRFCHVAVVFNNSMFVFGGYDGSNRLNDFQEFHFGPEMMNCEIPASTLVQDLASYVNDKLFSDITFVVEGRPIYAHKILCLRCPYFRALLAGEMKESREKEVVLPDVRYNIFIALLEHLYTDTVEISLEIAMDLFEAADKYGVERLKRMCESKMLTSITVENAASIFHAADMHNATGLRDKCLYFILRNFDEVTKTPCFEEMGRTNVELVFEILKKR